MRSDMNDAIRTVTDIAKELGPHPSRGERSSPGVDVFGQPCGCSCHRHSGTRHVVACCTYPEPRELVQFRDSFGQIISITVDQNGVYEGLVDNVVSQPNHDADGIIRWLAHISHREPKS